MTEDLKRAGLRITPQQRAVWSAFGEEENNHFPAFVEAGLLRALESRGAVLYEPNTDPDHHHFRCRSCDRLYEVHLDGDNNLEVSGASRFSVEHRTVLLGGLCPSCSRTGAVREL